MEFTTTAAAVRGKTGVRWTIFLILSLPISIYCVSQAPSSVVRPAISSMASLAPALPLPILFASSLALRPAPNNLLHYATG